MDISIIAINYNSSHFTSGFVRSIIQYTPPNISFEIIIVDNCSKIEDYNNLIHILDPYKKTVKIVRSNINLGFGGGNMLGTQFASGKYLAFINNDVLFLEDCFTSMINFLKNNPKTAVVSPQILDKDQKPAYSFHYFHGIRKVILGSWAVEINKKNKREKKLYTQAISVDCIQGCFMFFNREAFSEVGGFDTNIFLYHEEMDICYRLNQKGYTSILVPSTKFIHLEGESTIKNYNIKKERYLSKLYVLRKNHNYLKYSIIRFYYLILWFFKSIFTPKYIDFFFIIWKGAYLENSMKHKQKIKFLNEEV